RAALALAWRHGRCRAGHLRLAASGVTHRAGEPHQAGRTQRTRWDDGGRLRAGGPGHEAADRSLLQPLCGQRRSHAGEVRPGLLLPNRWRI
ncbi:hypothetical protein ABTK98_19505, partial [Acinetobacter baumannii]